MDCYDFAGFLDKTLRVRDIEDSSNNGLQLANQGKVTKIGFAVSASMEVFELARDAKCQLLVVHHGISWTDSLKYLTEVNYERVSFLIKNNIALYGCHLPLDKHPRLGNNVQLCTLLGLSDLKEFGEYHGVKIGFIGNLKRELPLMEFVKLIEDRLKTTCDVLDFGKDKIGRVAVISGGGSDLIIQAANKNVNLYLTGESKLFAYDLAKELKINLVYAGHYATETFGVMALSNLLRKKFKVETLFLDTPIKF